MSNIDQIWAKTIFEKKIGKNFFRFFQSLFKKKNFGHFLRRKKTAFFEIWEPNNGQIWPKMNKKKFPMPKKYFFSIFDKKMKKKFFDFFSHFLRRKFLPKKKGKKVSENAHIGPNNDRTHFLKADSETRAKFGGRKFLGVGSVFAM